MRRLQQTELQNAKEHGHGAPVGQTEDTSIALQFL